MICVNMNFKAMIKYDMIIMKMISVDDNYRSSQLQLHDYAIYGAIIVTSNRDVLPFSIDSQKWSPDNDHSLFDLMWKTNVHLWIAFMFTSAMTNGLFYLCITFHWCNINVKQNIVISHYLLT